MSLERKTPLRRTGFVARQRSALPAESAKRKKQRPARDAVRAEVLHRDKGCVARRYGLDGSCSGPLDVHEVIRRSRWSEGYLVVENCLALCRTHHRWVTEHDAEAKTLGLSLSRPLPG